jgi:hypothetical protein
MAFHYGFLDRTIISLELMFLITGLFSTLFLLSFLPESPRFLHSKKRYKEHALRLYENILDADKKAI